MDYDYRNTKMAVSAFTLTYYHKSISLLVQAGLCVSFVVFIARVEDQTIPAASIVFFGVLWYVSQMVSEYMLILCQLNIRNLYSNGEGSRVTHPENSRWIGLINFHSLVTLGLLCLTLWTIDKQVGLLTCIMVSSCLSDFLIFHGSSKPKLRGLLASLN